MPLALAGFVAAHLLQLPSALLVVDEERYVAQAVAFADGARAIPGAGRRFVGMPHLVMSDYPLGTSLLQAPFVALGGWRLASLASVVALVLATLMTARWLRDLGRDPAFALLIPGFLPAALFGRLAMSDVPSAMVVALALWLLWRSEGGDRRLAFVAGLAAVASLLFREFNLLLLAPFVIGALVRRPAARWALVAGGLAGLALRPALSAIVFGNAFYARDSVFGFSPAHLSFTVIPWGVALLVLLPGAALLPFLYRGPRRPEFVTAVVLYVGMHLLYGYDAIAENGTGKGILLMARYAIPALPLLAVMAADVVTRRYEALGERARAAARRVARLGAAGAVTIAVAVHPIAASQEGPARAIRTALYDNSATATPVVVNELALVKYLSPVYGLRTVLFRRDLDALPVAEIGARLPAFTLALLDRSDSEMFRADAARSEQLVERLAAGCAVALVHDSQPAPWARLRVLAVSGCAT